MNASNFIAIVFSKIWILILSIIICVGLAGGISYFTMTKQYQSTVSVYVLQKELAPPNNLNQDLLASISLIKDYRDLIKAKTVLRQVKKELEDENNTWAQQMTLEELTSKITVTNKNDTHVILINVKDGNPNYAAVIANKVASVFTGFTKKLTFDESIQVIDPAEANLNPVQPKPLIYMGLAFIIGILVGILAIFMQYSIANRHVSKRGISL